MAFNQKIIFTISLLTLLASVIVSGSDVGTIPDTREVGPSWSSEGQKILFHSYGPMNDGIFIIKPDGSDLQKIWGGEDASWSPDGTKVILIMAFFYDTDSSTEIALLDIETRNITRLTYNGNSLKESEPKYSPDGEKIAFNGAAKRTDVYIMDSNGANLQKLAENASSPEWSLDGKYLAYFTYDEVNEIWITRPDGTNKKKIFIDYKHSIYDRYRWTPDSRYLLLNNGSNIITKVNVDNTFDIKYVYDPVAPLNPKYSPDGNFITFTSSMDGGEYDLFVARSNGSDLYRLVFDTNPKLINATPDYFDKKGRPTPPPWPAPSPTPEPTFVETSTAAPTGTIMGTETPKVPGFPLLAVLVSFTLLVLMKRMKR